MQREFGELSDMVYISYLFPGCTNYFPTNEFHVADGTYDFRGTNCILALRDVIRFAGGDLNGDGAATAQDLFLFQTVYVNGDYDPRYDVNLDGTLSPADELDLVNLLNQNGGSVELVPGGPVHRIPPRPRPALRLSGIRPDQSVVDITLTGMPRGAMVSCHTAATLTNTWQTLTEFPARTATTNILTPIAANTNAAFFRAGFW